MHRLANFLLTYLYIMYWLLPYPETGSVKTSFQPRVGMEQGRDEKAQEQYITAERGWSRI